MRDIARKTKQQWKPTLQKLQSQWEQSQDFAIYNTQDYLIITDDCFVNWTSESLARVIQMLHNINYVPDSICDVYGGTGYATAILATAFPTTTIILYQPTQIQAIAAQNLFSQLKLTNVFISDTPVAADVMLAFEVLEHIKQPHKLFIDAKMLNANIIATQATFTQNAPGHYTEYLDHNNAICHRKKIAHKTYAWLDAQGYALMSSRKRHVHPKFFNRMPNIRISKSWQPPICLSPLPEIKFMKCFAYK